MRVEVKTVAEKSRYKYKAEFVSATGSTDGRLLDQLHIDNEAPMEEKLLAGTRRDDEQPWLRRRRPSTYSVVQIIAGGLVLVSMVMVFAVTVAALLYLAYTDVADPSRRPEIFAAVDGCSGLDDARVPRAFNLTVTVDNLGGKHSVRVGGGDAVVLYGGVPLATGVVARGLRVPPHGAGKLAIRAASGGVGLPDELAVAMAEEMKRAGGVVRLELRVLSLNDTALMCTANLNLGGGAAAPAPSPCERLVLRDESDGVMKPLLSHGKYDAFF